MKATAPITLAVASYGTRADAAEDCAAVWGARYESGFHHTAVAVLGRRDDGTLGLERYSSTAKHLAWGGALLGGPLLVCAPGAGAEMLTMVGLSGAGAIVEHLRRHTRPEVIGEAARVLEARDAALLVVVLDRSCAEVAERLPAAVERLAVGMVWGDLEAGLCHEVARPSSAPLLVAV